MRPRRRWGCWLGLAGALTLIGCAPEATPLLREDFDRIRTDVLRVEQTLQKSQAEIKADLQQADRQSAQALVELQRSIARLGARLDELGRDTGQIQGRLDELRRRVDALALQFDVAGAPPSGSPPPARPSVAASPPAAPPSPRPSSPGPAPAPTGGPPGIPASPGPAVTNPAGQASDFYQTAYIDYTRGNYNLAIAAFREFIRLYPNTDLAEKAQYWIGESYFSLARNLQARGEREKATQEYERAVQEFRRVLISYPRGDRVPSALYKEALALVELGQASLAEARLQFLLDQFPSTEEAAKAKDELTRLRKR